MSLAQTLTPARLRLMAGYAYARGELYWREGRVIRFEVEGDTIAGAISGTVTYEARLTAQNGFLVAKCTCPVEDAICKHAVALGLAYLGRDEAQPARVAGEGFALRADMVKWAEEHGVGHALLTCSDVLLPGVQTRVSNTSSVLSYTLGRIALRDMGAREGATRYVGAHGIVDAIVAEAAALLEREAASVRDGIAEEAARAVRDEPLWQKLLEARAKVRAVASPRSRAARAGGTWSFDPTGTAITWKERARIVRSGEDYSAVALATRLAVGGDGAVDLECTCRTAGGRCTHALALIDATLDILEDPARADDATRLRDELLRPGWARALRELEHVEAHAQRPRTTIEVWWHLEEELGGLGLTAVVKKLGKRGLSSGARMTPARLLDEHREHLDERDLQIAEHAAAWTPNTRVGTYPVRAFAGLVGHPRVTSDACDEPVAVRRAKLGFAAHPSGDHIVLEPTLAGDGIRERMSPKLLGALLRTFAPGEPLLVAEPDIQRYLLVDAGDEARRVWAALERHGDRFPPESHGQLLDRLARIEGRLPIELPEELKGSEIGAQTTIVVRLRLLDTALELELFVRPGPGAPIFAPGHGPRDVMLANDGRRGYVRRDLAGERDLARAAIAYLPLDGAAEGPPNCFRPATTDDALAVVAALQTPPPGVEVEWVEGMALVTGRADAKALRVQVDDKRDWFGILGELKVEAGRIELAVLLDAARRQRRFVRLDDQRWVELSETLRQKLQAVADQTFVGRGRLELSPGAVGAIEALAAAGARVTAADAWEQLTAKLAAARALRPKPPAALAATLRDYQAEGHAWLTRVAAWGAGACLADDMGLGKTVQAIAVLLDRARKGPALVIAPTSVAFNWVDELARFAPTLRPVVYRDRREGALAKLGKKDVVIASYGLLVRDIKHLAARSWTTIVFDEAQALKNAATQRAKAARALRADFRIALSGTPFENHLGELWSLYAIVFPGLLGSWDQFRDRYAAPIERTDSAEARGALSRVLRPFLLRRTKAEVARELPPRTEVDVPVALSADEWSLYEDARLAAVAEVTQQTKDLREEQRRFAVLAALTRLRLLASHPRLYDPTSPIGSSKMRRLVELLEELRSEGHRALVFSQFTSHLALVRDELGRAGFTTLYLDGATPVAQRGKLVRAFQDGEGDAFLISTKAGGTGINLTAADYVIHLDPWWNPAVEDQATDRAHRIGQDRPVTVYRLVTRGTIEEKILAMHRDKRALVAGVLEGSSAAARLTTRDLLGLLAGGDHDAIADDGEERPQRASSGSRKR